jgi:hypothetical protein
MDHNTRLIGLAFVVVWTLFRLLRYLKVGLSKRPSTAVPGSAGVLAQPVESAPPAPASASPIGPPDSRSGGLAAGLAGLLVWLAGNAVIWACLFLLPPLEQVSVMSRLVVGVLANFYLIYLARTAAARLRGQAGRDRRAGGDPIS